MRIGRKPRAGLVGLSALIAVGMLAPAGASAYSGGTSACAGDAILSGGASLQRAAQLNWGADILDSTIGVPPLSGAAGHVAQSATGGFGFNGAPGAGSCSTIGHGVVSYDPIGSGGGRNLWGANGGSHDNTADFVASDEPPSTGEQANINAVGMTSTNTVETMPVAQAAVAVIVNLPAGCTSASRVVTAAALEAVADGASTTWGSLIPGITGTGCSTAAITRAVRLDSSGSTFAFKTFLNSVNSRWSTPTDYLDPTNNTAWPNDAGATAVIRPANTGGGPLADLVSSTQGSIGYVDLATARQKGFYSGASSSKFWLTITVPKNPAPGNVNVDPATTPTGSTASGANCGTSRVYRNVPASTQGNWFTVDGVQATYRSTEYPICTLTYDLAYDKYSLVSGYTGADEPRVRTVYDYLNWVVSTTGGQVLLASNDYQELPSAIQGLSATGAANIDW